MYRQWDRAITDNLLYRVLPLLKETRINKSTLFWIDINQLKDAPKCKHAILGLVVKNNILISCFWQEFTQEHNAHCDYCKNPSKTAIHFHHV